MDLIEPGTFYGDRIYQLDLALAKILRFGGTRLRVAADIFNALNNDAVLNENEAFGRFRQPTEILLARFVQVLRAAELLRRETDARRAAAPGEGRLRGRAIGAARST